MNALLTMIVLLLMSLPSFASETYLRRYEVLGSVGFLDEVDEGRNGAPYGIGFGYRLYSKGGVEFLYVRSKDEETIFHPPSDDPDFSNYTSHGERTVQVFSGRYLYYFSSGQAQPYVVAGGAFLNDNGKGNDRYGVPGGTVTDIVFDETRRHFALDTGAGIRYFFVPYVSCRAEAGILFTSPSWIRLSVLLGYHW